MPARSSWEGFLQFNLISIPVKAFSAIESNQGRISFHMIHANCGERIRYQKVCPVHGEVDNDEIVSGREEAKGEYVTVKKEELKKLKDENDRVVDVDLFIHPDALDPIYGSGRSFFLLPDGKTAAKAYSVLQKAMEGLHRFALGRIVLSGKKQIALIRAQDGLMIMTLMYFNEQIKKPESLDDDIPDVKVSKEETRLAETLIETATTKLDYDKYKDTYTDRVEKLLARKSSHGVKHRRASLKAEPRGNIINLMDALKRSLQSAKRSAPPTASPTKRRGGKLTRRTG